VTKYLLRLRTYPEGGHTDVWLLRRDGAAQSCLLYGSLYPPTAEKLAESLGLPVEREESPLAGARPLEPKGCDPVPVQKTLFEGHP